MKWIFSYNLYNHTHTHKCYARKCKWNKQNVGTRRRLKIAWNLSTRYFTPKSKDLCLPAIGSHSCVFLARLGMLKFILVKFCHLSNAHMATMGDGKPAALCKSIRQQFLVIMLMWKQMQISKYEIARWKIVSYDSIELQFPIRSLAPSSLCRRRCNFKMFRSISICCWSNENHIWQWKWWNVHVEMITSNANWMGNQFQKCILPFIQSGIDHNSHLSTVWRWTDERLKATHVHLHILPFWTFSMENRFIGKADVQMVM